VNRVDDRRQPNFADRMSTVLAAERSIGTKAECDTLTPMPGAFRSGMALSFKLAAGTRR
jgi:hypothetical protein